MKALDVLSTIGAMMLAATPLAVVGAAHAETGSGAVSIQVGDLDFSNSADVTRFDARVARAAGQFCDSAKSRDLERACIADVRAEAVSKLGTEQRSAMAGDPTARAQVASAH